MSDLSDVTAALASTVNDLINAYGAPAPIAVMKGWPLPNDLQSATASGKVLVSVYPQPGAASNVTRFQWDALPVVPAVVTMTAAMASGVITFGGTVTLPLNVAVFAGGVSYAYAAASGDTVAKIIEQLVYLLQNAFAVTFNATTLTFANPPVDLAVHFGGQGSLLRENARQKQLFQITVWAPTAVLRAGTVKAFEPGLYGLNAITLPDGTAGMLLSQRSFDTDTGEVDNVYRRDVIVSVEYGVTELIPAWSVVRAEAPITH